MNWSRIFCAFGRHDLTKWRKLVGAQWADPHSPSARPLHDRHCKRKGCGFFERKAIKPRRPSNFADTVQFVPVIPSPPPPQDDRGYGGLPRTVHVDYIDDGHDFPTKEEK